jgi:hypothetical protein
MVWNVLFCVLRCIPAVATGKALPTPKYYILMLLCQYDSDLVAFAVVALMCH